MKALTTADASSTWHLAPVVHRAEAPGSAGSFVLPEAHQPASVSVDKVYHAFTHPRRFPQTTHDAAVLAAARPLQVSSGAKRVAAFVWSPAPLDEVSPRAASRSRVLMVHGWESRASHWGAWMAPLLAAGFEVVAFDSPGHGDSQGDTADVKQVGQAALDVARAAGRVDAVVSHSMGSAATLYALAHGLQVRASVHLAGPSSVERVTRHFAWQAGLHKAAWPGFQELVAQRLEQPLASLELASLRHGLRHPGLVWHDPQDAEVPYAESRALKDAWPAAILREASGLGHRRILRDAALIAQSIEFLLRAP